MREIEGLLARVEAATGADRAMSAIAELLPKSAVGLRLYRIDTKDRLLAYEAVRFTDGWSAVETTLRRAAISGRVEVGGDIQDHFADALDATESIVETVALDGGSFKALKNHWMRCKLDKSLSDAALLTALSTSKSESGT